MKLYELIEKLDPDVIPKCNSHFVDEIEEESAIVRLFASELFFWKIT